MPTSDPDPTLRLVRLQLSWPRDGSLYGQLSEGDHRIQASWVIPAGEARAWCDEVTAMYRALLHGAGLVGPGRVADAETKLGSRLAFVVAGPEPRAALAELLPNSHGCEPLAVLSVETDNESIAALPWELLPRTPGSPPIEVEGSAVVMRREKGSRTRVVTRGRRGLRALVWMQAGARGELHDAFSKLSAMCRELKIAEPTVVDGRGALSPGRGSAFLHVISHGEREPGSDVLVVHSGEEGGPALEPFALDARLDRLLARVDGVFLSVCHSGGRAEQPAIEIARMVLARGVPFCIGYRDEVSVAADAVFVKTFYENVLEARGVASCVYHARHALREEGLVSPAGRWHLPVAYYSDARVIDHVIVRPPAQRRGCYGLLVALLLIAGLGGPIGQRACMGTPEVPVIAEPTPEPPIVMPPVQDPEPPEQQESPPAATTKNPPSTGRFQPNGTRSLNPTGKPCQLDRGYVDPFPDQVTVDGRTVTDPRELGTVLPGRHEIILYFTVDEASQQHPQKVYCRDGETIPVGHRATSESPE